MNTTIQTNTAPPISDDEIAKCQKKFGLTYHITYSVIGQKLAGFSGKDVLEVGGSMPHEFVFDYLKVKSWTALETPDYEDALKEAGGLTHKGTILKGENKFDQVSNKNYNFFLSNIEELPEEHYEQYDLIFSIATFEHIHKLPQALEKMYKALRSGGKLFTIFCPIWSAHDGHHLPQIEDQSGNKFSFANSPIPPWGHLTMTPPQMQAHLLKKTDKETASLMTYYIYNSPHINRFFTEDYIQFINQSSFTANRIELMFSAKLPEESQKKLEAHLPGRKHFANNGIMAVLHK